MENMLQTSDFVGVTFWIISVSMVASTFFFFAEANNVGKHWGTSVRVAGLITLIAAVHYYYMRDVWVSTGETPTVLRYIDWLLTVPLQMIEFYLILAAVGAATAGMFWRLLVGTLVMLIAGFMGEAGYINATVGFVVGMAGWIYIIYEIFKGEASQLNENSGNAASQQAFKTIRAIVTFGWAIYPLGYYMAYLGAGAGDIDMKTLNIVYNLADLVNKVAFGLAIWVPATSDSETA